MLKFPQIARISQNNCCEVDTIPVHRNKLLTNVRYKSDIKNNWVKFALYALYTVIGSDNILSPVWCQAIIWTNAAILSDKPQGTYFSKVLFEIQ